MKLNIKKLEGLNMFDKDPEKPCWILEPSDKPADGGLPNSVEKTGVRFTVPMTDPTPGFFFALAGMADDRESCTLVFDEENNMVGAFFN